MSVLDQIVMRNFRARLPIMTAKEAADKAQELEYVTTVLEADHPDYEGIRQEMYDYMGYSALLERFEEHTAEV